MLALKQTPTQATIDGIMLAGIKTTDITAISDISFTGKGRGIYGSETETYNTIFDVHVTVDATNNNDVTIFTSNTCKMGGLDCGVGGADRVNMLNLDPVTAAYANNSIISNAASAGTLIGNINARFYGADLGEFGGAFALVAPNEIDPDLYTSYYYGAFGAKVLGSTYGGYSVVSNISRYDDFDNNPMTDDTLGAGYTLVDAHTKDHGGFNSVADAANNNVATIKLLGLSASASSNNAEYTRDSASDDWNIYFKTRNINPTSIANVIGSAADITFDASGNVTSLTVNVNEGDTTTDVAYSANDFTNVNGVATSNAVSKDGTLIADTASLTVDRSLTTFGFQTEYMAMIAWNADRTTDDLEGLSGTTYRNNGLMLAGMQSTDISGKSGASG